MLLPKKPAPVKVRAVVLLGNDEPNNARYLYGLNVILATTFISPPFRMADSVLLGRKGVHLTANIVVFFPLSFYSEDLV